MEQDNNQFDQLPIEERLRRARAMREQMIALLKEKITALRKERDEMVAQYEEEIGIVYAELSSLGTSSDSDQPKDVGVKAYNYLRANAGRRIQAGALMAAIHCTGAVASVVLAPFIQNGKVKREGGSRASTYWVEPEDSSE